MLVVCSLEREGEGAQNKQFTIDLSGLMELFG